MARILLLEDEYFLLRLFAKALAAAGHDVDTAMSVEAAFELLEAHSYDVFISDIRIGQFDGETLIARLGEIYVPSNCEILVISAHMERYESLCRAVGLRNFLSKPFANATLVEAVQKILKGSP
ncbi:MAG: response regulator [Anaerolineae bacterium]|nr:response regulator [Anaerolineae bacterium]